MSTFLPYGRQSISEADISAVVDALRSDFLTTGPLVDRFELELAKEVGTAEAVVVANGTAALHLAVLSENLTPKDVVIVPAITFAATANAVAYCGANVMFADVDSATGLISEEGFNKAITDLALHYPQYRFAGVIPVHYAGRPVDLSHINQVCSDHGAFIIEDSCHALGTTGPQGKIGSCMASDMACFSFHPVKTLTTGEGGAITLNDPDLARRLRQLRSHGIEREPERFLGLGYEGVGNTGPWAYEMQVLGYNYRLPDLNCALGLSQLAQLQSFAARRRALIDAYQVALRTRQVPVMWTPPTACDPVFHLFAVQIDFAALGTTRAAVMEGLKSRGIGSQVHYIPVHRQPYWQKRALHQRNLPEADRFYLNTLSLPLYAEMSDDDPGRVITSLSEVLHGL